MSSNSSSSIEFDGSSAPSVTLPPTIAPTMAQSAGGRAISSSVPFSVLQLDIPLVFLGITLVLVFKMWLDSKNVADPANDNVRAWRIRQSRYNDETHGNGDSGNSDGNEDSVGIRNLLIEDWVSLYKKAFDSNGNQVTLSSKHFVGMGSETNKGQSGTEESSSMSTISHSNTSDDAYGDIEFGDTIEENDPTKIRLFLDSEGINSSESFLCLSTTCKAASGSISSEKKSVLVDGSCVICYEPFELGDEIVWSSSSSSTCCKHVFHKECMVQYLANNSKRKFRKYTGNDVPTSLEIEAPCPICRRRFCTISDEDLRAVIKSRCLESDEVDTESPEPFQSPSSTEEDHEASTDAADTESSQSRSFIEVDNDMSLTTESDAGDTETPESSQSPSIIEEDHNASPTTD